MIRFSELPRPLRDLLQEPIDTAIKHRQTIRTKEAGVSKIITHLANQTFPRSVRFRAELSIPTSLASPENLSTAHALQAEFNEALRTFQLEATKVILKLSELSLADCKTRARNHLAAVDGEIISFYRTFHSAQGTNLDVFNTAFTDFKFDNVDSIDTSNSIVALCVSHIHAWRQECITRWDSILANETLAIMQKNRKKKATIAAEAMIIDDTSNQTVRALIQQELKPIREQLGRLSLAPPKAERVPSASKKQTPRSRSTSRSTVHSRSSSRTSQSSRNSRSDASRNTRKVAASGGSRGRDASPRRPHGKDRETDTDARRHSERKQGHKKNSASTSRSTKRKTSGERPHRG
jgi:hypothetical protein